MPRQLMVRQNNNKSRIKDVDKAEEEEAEDVGLATIPKDLKELVRLVKTIHEALALEVVAVVVAAALTIHAIAPIRA